MKSLLVLTTTLATALAVSAQSTNPPTFIKGAMDIKFNTATEPVVKGKTRNVYRLDIIVANSARFSGTITDTPQIIEGLISKAVTQPRSLYYDITCDVINPNNPAQRKPNVGTMHGSVPISSEGTYRYDDGSFKLDILTGTPQTSKFRGMAYGKPLVRPANWLESLKREAVSITRTNPKGGKPVTVTLTKYDKMEFRQCVLADGPSGNYSEVTVNGEMLYDYDKKCWFMNNMTMQYAEGNNIKIDRVTGTIRWMESPQRKTNGEGEYDFDVRVNEPLPTEAASFASSSQSDESAFFDANNAVPSLTGTMKYKDSLTPDGDTAASHVDIDLNGNLINKQQTMALAKEIIFAAVVPMNSD